MPLSYGQNLNPVLRTEPITVSLRFRSLLVDRPHPKAEHELVSTVLSSSASPTNYTITVVNEFVLLLISGQRVLAWNWVTGKCHARIDSAIPGAITDAIPVQRTAFIAFRQLANTPRLEVYTFSAKEPTSDAPPPVLRAVYCLPSLQEGVEMDLQCRCDPPPFEYARLIHPDLSSLPPDIPSYLRRPFEIQETPRIVVLAMNVHTAVGVEQSRDLAIVVPLQTFTATDLDPDAPPGDPRVVPASGWMDSAQVLTDIPLLDSCVCYVYGTRFATLYVDSLGRGNLCVNEFNPATIAHLKHHHLEKQSEDLEYGESLEEFDITEWTEGNTDVGLMLRKLDFTDQTFFKDPVRGGAPFLASVSTDEIVVEQNETIGVMIDDERVLLVRVCGPCSMHY